MKNFILILLLIFTGIIYSQDFWQHTSGPCGGGITDLYAHPEGVVFGGTGAGVGLYRSDDNGKNWDKILTLPLRASTNKICCDPSGQYIFAITNGGFFRSSDKGISWDSLSGLKLQTMAINQDGRMFIYGNSLSNYVTYTSSDYGTTLISSSIAPSGVTSLYDIAINFVGDIFISSRVAIYRSSNGGANWVKIINGLTTLSINSIRIKPDGTLFATTNGGGVYRSTDNGNQWTQINYMLWDFQVNALELKGGDTIFVGAETEGIFRSDDNGNNWIQTGTELRNNSVKSITFTGSGEILTGTNDGIFKSTNNGTTWNLSSQGYSNSDIESIAVNNSGEVYCSVAGKGLFRSTDKGRNWTKLYDSLKTYVTNNLGFGPTGTMYKTTFGNLHKSTNNGINWTKLITTNGFKISNDNTVYSYFNYFNISKDDGKTWTSTYTHLFDTVFVSMAINPITHSLFLGTRGSYLNSMIARSTDNGLTWSNCTNGINLAGYVYAIAVNSKGHVFITAENTDRMYRSTDNGDSWTAVGAGLTNVVRSLVIDSNDRIFAASPFAGMFVSSDNGNSWESVNSGLYTPNLANLAISNDGYIYCGSWVDGIFRTSTSTVGVNDRVTPSRNYNLSQNFPNPFNPNTTINYSIPERGNVKLTVYNSLGQVISELVNEEKPAGNFSIQFNAANLPSGVYFYQIKSGNFNSTKKLILIK